MKNELAYKVYENEQEYLNSPELAKLFEGYENTEKKYAGKWSTFVKALIVKDDRYAEYGINFKIYRISKVKESGLLTMKEVSLGSTITNSALIVVDVSGENVRFTDTRIKKTDAGRAYAAAEGFIVF
jgi:hypothetical protein